MIKYLRDFLNRRYGIIINLDNVVFSFNGDKLNIEIPVESFEKYRSEIVCSDKIVEFIKGRKGFITKI